MVKGSPLTIIVIKMPKTEVAIWYRPKPVAPILRDKKILKTWEGLSMSETKGRYDKLMASIKPYAQELGIEELPQDYSKWYSETSKLVGERVAPEGKRVSDVLLSGFKKTSDDQKLFDRIKSGFSTFWNKGTASIIADDNIKEVYEQCTTGLSTKNLPKGIKLPPELYSKNKEVREAALNKLTANIKEMLPNLKPEEADAKAKDIAYSLTELNKILTSGAKETIEKQRDLHLGNASVDVLGMIGSLGLLGGAVATADTKEEKTSTVLDLGIPLISTLGCSIIGGIKNISGLKSALFGLAVGQATSMAAKAIGKAVKNSKDKAMTKIEQHNTKKELVA